MFSEAEKGYSFNMTLFEFLLWEGHNNDFFFLPAVTVQYTQEIVLPRVIPNCSQK